MAATGAFASAGVGVAPPQQGKVSVAEAEKFIKSSAKTTTGSSLAQRLANWANSGKSDSASVGVGVGGAARSGAAAGAGGLGSASNVGRQGCGASSVNVAGGLAGGTSNTNSLGGSGHTGSSSSSGAPCGSGFNSAGFGQNGASGSTASSQAYRQMESFMAAMAGGCSSAAPPRQQMESFMQAAMANMAKMGNGGPVAAHMGSSLGSSGGGGSTPGDKYSDLGAKLRDINWSQENLVEKVGVSDQYQAVSRSRNAQEVAQWRESRNITVSGRAVPNPIFTFEETGFPQYLLDSFKRQGFKAPTDIQMQGWGPAMTGRDMVGIAKTGSGKTLAFGIPGILNIQSQPQLQLGDGPLMLVLAPTRELAQQIDIELKKVLPNQMRAACIYGGAPKNYQQRELNAGVHILTATPGRLIDFLDCGVTNLRRVTYLVMDEADRMLDMGFEPDVRKVVSQIRPDRQTLLWSATWPKNVERLAHDFLRDIVRIQVGSDELTVNADITQHFEFTNNFQKTMLLNRTLMQLQQQGMVKMLVFSSTKKGCEQLCDQIRQLGHPAATIHGDKDQSQREKALNQLRQQQSFVLVATDVASRGLDIPKLPAVLNYDMPDEVEDYVHRIGRTGRAGNKGLAISFFVPNRDCHLAKGLIDLLKGAGQEVPQQLVQATMLAPPERVYYGKKNSGGSWRPGPY